MEYDRTRRWNSQSTWLQRDVKSLKSLLRMGDTFTTGDVFDSVQFRGIQLMSDDEMLPDSQRGFAPTIRGMAHSNAKVTISQHGYVIYETFVSPGAFAINDLYPTAQSGDLEVQVKESDGSVRTFTQPFSAVPFMLREGRVKYNLSAGRFRSAQRQGQSPTFLQGTLFYGLPAEFTLYGAGLPGVGAWRRARFGRTGVDRRRCDVGKHHSAVGKALGRSFGARAVSEGFCRHGDFIQSRQLSLLLQRLI